MGAAKLGDGGRCQPLGRGIPTLPAASCPAASFKGLHKVPVADVKRAAFVQRLRAFVHDADPIVQGLATGLFGDPSQWGAFVQKPKLSLGLVDGRGVQIDAAVQKVAVEVRDQRTDVAPPEPRIGRIAATIDEILCRSIAARLDRIVDAVRARDLTGEGAEKRQVSHRGSAVMKWGMKRQ